MLTLMQRRTARLVSEAGHFVRSGYRSSGVRVSNSSIEETSNSEGSSLRPDRQDSQKSLPKALQRCRREDLNAPGQRHHGPRSVESSFAQPVLADRRVTP